MKVALVATALAASVLLSGCASDAPRDNVVTHEELCEMYDAGSYEVTVGSKSKTTYTVLCEEG